MNEYQPAPAPMPPPTPAIVAPPPPAIMPAPPQSHAGLWVTLGVIVVVLALALSGYFYLTQSGYYASDTALQEQTIVLDPAVASLEAELQAEPLGDLGSELGAIEQQLAQ